MKVSFCENEEDYDPCDYNDYEIIKCVKQGKKGIHDERIPSSYSFEQQKKQLKSDADTIDELFETNHELYENFCNEYCKNISLYHEIVMRDFFLYLKTSETFWSDMILKDIEESVKNFEKSPYKLKEITAYYLVYIEILSFFENILYGDEKFRRTSDYCFDFNTLEKMRNNNIEGEENFDKLFHESKENGKEIYKQFKAKNGSEVKSIIDNLYKYSK